MPDIYPAFFILLNKFLSSLSRNRKEIMSKKDNTYKPEWTPENAGDEFAVRVVKGVQPSRKKSHSAPSLKNNLLSVDEYVNGVLKSDRIKLARAITLVESNSPKHHQLSQEVLQKLLPHSGNSLRIGITGTPGAGKSTLIESLGMNLLKEGHKVAVLTVDPSSSISKGSILGDKTRMEKLAKEENCFIRPSPSGGTLGGVARKTRETITLCEAAGYDVILIETVGVGQSEITVRSMVDFFLLVLIPGGGDELQGIKKGVIELTDAVLINKADGKNEQLAKLSKSEYANALHYIQHATKGWQTKALTCSALKGKGIKEIWEMIKEFEIITKESGIFLQRRKEQSLEWVFRMVEDGLKDSFYNHPKVKEELPTLKEKILEGMLPATTAAEYLLNLLKTSPN